MRKLPNCLLLVLLAGVLALAGSGKAKPSPSPAAGLMNMGKLHEAFPSPAPEVQASLNKLQAAARYGQFEEALVELDKLAQFDQGLLELTVAGGSLELGRTGQACPSAQPH